MHYNTQNIIDGISSIKTLTSTDVNKAYWVLNDTPFLVEFNEEITYADISSLQAGWHMISTSDIEDLSSLSVKSIWSYKDSKWYAYSNTINMKSYDIELLESVFEYDGVWVYVE
ncbi:MAG: hypothetical protein JXQ66_07840 [Campylobacterales bacterium]|nr:hypothetical protein [Campylobacterales bacterium]